MIQHVVIPKLGQTMEEAIIEKWHKKEGDPVEKGDILLEITTDKATLEVESFLTGAIRKVLAPEGTTLPVNTVIALVGQPDDPLPDNLPALEAAARGEGVTTPKADPHVAAAPPAPADTAPVQAPHPPTVEGGPPGRILVSPRARRLARKEKVPLAILRGAGPHGRIVEKDVLAYLDKRKLVKATPVAKALAAERGIDIATLSGTGPGGRITKQDVLNAPTAAPVGEHAEPSAMRRIVAERMSRSKREAPHYYLLMNIDMTSAVAMRKRINDRDTMRIGFHDLFIRACARAMRECPAMNITWHNGALRRRSEVNIGLAVALDEGLIVPVVRNADGLALAEAAAASKDLITKARSKRLTPGECEGGCLTVTNLGMFDVESFLPIINPGESAILGLGKIADTPVVVNGEIVVRAVMSVTLSADHRVVDGAVGATFLKRVKDLLEEPQELA